MKLVRGMTDSTTCVSTVLACDRLSPNAAATTMVSICKLPVLKRCWSGHVPFPVLIFKVSERHIKTEGEVIFLGGRDIFYVLFKIQQTALCDDVKATRAALLREVIPVVLLHHMTEILSSFFSQCREFGTAVASWNDALHPSPVVDEMRGR